MNITFTCFRYDYFFSDFFSLPLPCFCDDLCGILLVMLSFLTHKADTLAEQQVWCTILHQLWWLQCIPPISPVKSFAYLLDAPSHCPSFPFHSCLPSKLPIANYFSSLVWVLLCLYLSWFKPHRPLSPTQLLAHFTFPPSREGENQKGKIEKTCRLSERHFNM